VWSENRSTSEQADDVLTWVRGERLTVTLHHEPDHLRIDLFGELDVASAPVLARTVPPRTAAPAVVLDLARLSFLDAAGLRQLIALVSEGRAVTLRCPSRLVRRVLEVTGADVAFEIEPS